MIAAKTIAQTLSRTLGEAGYTRRGKTWRLQRAEVIGVVNLQKSTYSDQHFLNIGFYLRNQGDVREPKENQCHARGRAGGAFPDHEPPVCQILDAADDHWNEAEHEELLASLIAEDLIPLSTRLVDLAALKSAIGRGELSGWLLTKVARELTG